MRKMLIGLSCRCDGTPPNQRRFYDNESYFQYVLAGGGLPVLIGSVDEETAALYAEQLDGLIITGGEDVDPKFYNEENTESYPTFEDIDLADFNLYKAFRKADKPILGICRGIQVINVIEGGTLIQDIHSFDASKLEHNQRKYVPVKEIGETAHNCTFTEGTRLYEIFGATHPVNTYHHQNIKVPAPGFTVSAMSEDGLIEGIEKNRVFAVQWHPERLINDSKHLAIVQSFVKECEESAE